MSTDGLCGTDLSMIICVLFVSSMTICVHEVLLGTLNGARSMRRGAHVPGSGRQSNRLICPYLVLLDRLCMGMALLMMRVVGTEVSRAFQSAVVDHI